MPCNNCNNNTHHTHPCTETQTYHHICDCTEVVNCDCPVADLSTDCSTYKADDIVCENVIVVAKNTILSDALKNIVDWVCGRLAEIQNYFVIKNVGAGAKVFKQTNLIGEKELRTIVSTDNTVTITEETDTIDLSVDGSETKITAGTNVTITGAGTIASPYTINSSDINTTYSAGTGLSLVGTTFNNTAPDQVVVLTGSGATNVTGTYPNFTIASSAADGSETKINDGVTTNVSGVGTIASPYIIEVENLQKVISAFPYTLTSADDKYTIFVNNIAANVIINVPDGLVNNFSCVFIQEGTGEITIQASGTATVLYPSTLQNKIKAQNYWAMVEKKQATDNYFLLGSLMPV